MADVVSCFMSLFVLAAADGKSRFFQKGYYFVVQYNSTKSSDVFAYTGDLPLSLGT